MQKRHHGMTTIRFCIDWIWMIRSWRRRGALHTKSLLIMALIFALAVGAAADDTYVRLNRVGYRPADLKIAVAMGRSALTDTFEVVDARTDKVVFEHDANPSAETWGEFKYHAR